MDFMDEFQNKEFIKNINNSNSDEICKKIRSFLVEKVTNNGGHLASNLGVVELTLALHKVFDFPVDKIVFDVGHQSYVHKILSGRAELFDSLRKFNGLSGFPKVEESEYDCFNTGHSSTSVSAALGIAKARDIIGAEFDVVALIGDGALTGGMAFEALNDAGASKTKIIIILNDNEMSINQNVGGMSAYLSMLRLGKRYISAKSKLNVLLSKLGCFGEKIIKFIKATKDMVKLAAIHTPLFEELGITYIGIIDGHNINELTEALNKAKNIQGPVLVHVYTKKGKGYAPAENNPDVYHGISAKAVLNNKYKNSIPATYTELFGNFICKKAQNNDKVVAITAAMGQGCGLKQFAKEYPNRFFDVGIAEQHAVTFAAGLASRGLIPFFAVYSTFLQRAYDQILHDVCLQNLHVIFAIDRAGVVGEDGETHQGIFDLSYLTHIPNMTILCPSCEKEFEYMMDYAIEKCYGPVAIRYPKARAAQREWHKCSGVWNEVVIENGEDIVILSVGRMLECSVECAYILSENKIGVKVINVGCIKPIDMHDLCMKINNPKMIVTIEDNVVSGGAGQYVTNCLNINSKVMHFGFHDCFVCQGTQAELFEEHNLTPSKISHKINEVYNNEFKS